MRDFPPSSGDSWFCLLPPALLFSLFSLGIATGNNMMKYDEHWTHTNHTNKSELRENTVQINRAYILCHKNCPNQRGLGNHLLYNFFLPINYYILIKCWTVFSPAIIARFCVCYFYTSSTQSLSMAHNFFFLTVTIFSCFCINPHKNTRNCFIYTVNILVLSAIQSNGLNLSASRCCLPVFSVSVRDFKTLNKEIMAFFHLQ